MNIWLRRTFHSKRRCAGSASTSPISTSECCRSVLSPHPEHLIRHVCSFWKWKCLLPQQCCAHLHKYPGAGHADFLMATLPGSFAVLALLLKSPVMSFCTDICR